MPLRNLVNNLTPSVPLSLERRGGGDLERGMGYKIISLHSFQI
jgi:hypothetical protein